jgi:hypothetical protein
LWFFSRFGGTLAVDKLEKLPPERRIRSAKASYSLARWIGFDVTIARRLHAAHGPS